MKRDIESIPSNTFASELHNNTVEGKKNSAVLINITSRLNYMQHMSSMEDTTITLMNPQIRNELKKKMIRVISEH